MHLQRPPKTAPLNSNSSTQWRAKLPKRQIVLCSAHQVRARWCIDIRYGVKGEAVQLLQEWVRDIGSQAGLTRFNTQINSGSLGVPESRLEMEVALESISALEAFRAQIPMDLHKAWSQRAQNFIIDGSPTWQVYSSCPVFPEESELSTSSLPEYDFKVRPRARPKPLIEGVTELDATQESSDTQKVAIDWKGDPMTINPGDKMPFI